MLDIGNQLKQLRLQQNLSLNEISEATKINTKYLEALENNNFDFMPRIYVRSFLKSYLRSLNVDEKEFLDAFDNLFTQKPVQKIEDEKIEIQQSELANQKDVEESDIKVQPSFQINLSSKKFYYLTGGVVFIILILIIVISSISKNQITSNSIQQASFADDSASQITEDFSNIANKDSLTLGIKALDSVWIQVNIDDNKIEEVYLRSGDSKKFRGKNNFKLLVGNAGGITLYLNETELPFTGVQGSVKRLKVDKEGVKLIQAKYDSKNQ